MIIAWDNKADAATVTTDSEIATLPASNVQTQHVAQKWHTAAGVKSAYLLLDLLASLSCAVLAVLGTNLTSAATIRIRASDADPTGAAGEKYDSGTVSAGIKAGYGAIYKSFAAASARYWRIDLADASLPDNMQVGRVFLGPSWVPATSGANNAGGQDYGWAITPLDPSAVDESYGGQEYGDERPQRRQVDFILNWLTKAEAFDNALAMARSAGIVRDVLAINDPTETYLSEQAVYGRMTSLAPIQNRLTTLWAQKFTIRERL